MQSIALTAQVVYLIGRVWFIRRNLGKRPLMLPGVHSARTIFDEEIPVLVERVDRLLGRLLSKGSHHCFYRSVVLAVLFRKQGVPLVVNIGGRSLSSSSRMKAHSWLTLNGQPFYEHPNSLTIYPFDMGYNADRSIRYWIGPDFDDGVLKNGNVTRGNAARPAGAPLS